MQDEAHKARRRGSLGRREDEPNNLMAFMLRIATRTRNLLLGTATPIQTEVRELWDLLRILNQAADFRATRSRCATKRPSIRVGSGGSCVRACFRGATWWTSWPSPGETKPGSVTDTGDLKLAPAATIAGGVRNADQKPVPGARVRLRD